MGGAKYSFTGALTKPRQVLPLGYISWFDTEAGDVMQLQYPPGGPRIVNLSQMQGALGDQSLREFVNRGEASAPVRANLSKVPNEHRLTKARDRRRTAMTRAAEAKANITRAGGASPGRRRLPRAAGSSFPGRERELCQAHPCRCDLTTLR